MDIRKTIFAKETINADEMGSPCAPIIGAAVLRI